MIGIARMKSSTNKLWLTDDEPDDGRHIVYVARASPWGSHQFPLGCSGCSLYCADTARRRSIFAASSLLARLVVRRCCVLVDAKLGAGQTNAWPCFVARRTWCSQRARHLVATGAHDDVLAQREADASLAESFRRRAGIGAHTAENWLHPSCEADACFADDDL